MNVPMRVRQIPRLPTVAKCIVAAMLVAASVGARAACPPHALCSDVRLEVAFNGAGEDHLRKAVEELAKMGPVTIRVLPAASGGQSARTSVERVATKLRSDLKASGVANVNIMTR